MNFLSDSLDCLLAFRRSGVKVEIIDASIELKPVIQNLYSLYLHDLSKFVDALEIDERGLFITILLEL